MWSYFIWYTILNLQITTTIIFMYYLQVGIITFIVLNIEVQKVNSDWYLIAEFILASLRTPYRTIIWSNKKLKAFPKHHNGNNGHNCLMATEILYYLFMRQALPIFPRDRCLHQPEITYPIMSSTVLWI